MGRRSDRRSEGARALARLAPALGATALAAASVLVAELVWTVRRPLPALEGHDASQRASGDPGEVPLRMVVLGDSTTTGPGLDAPDQIWLHRALDQMGLAGRVEVVSLAVGGSRAADVARRVPEVAPLAPDVVVVAVGSNDAIHGTPAPRFERELGALVDELSALAPVGVANVGDLGSLPRVPPPLTSVLRRRSRIISRRIERVVAARPAAVLLDVTAADRGFRGADVFGADLFHPNAAGHQLWGEAALPGLRQLLTRTGGVALS